MSEVAMREVEITKLDVSAKTTKKVTDYVPEEKPLHLFVNNNYWATILCSPANLKEMAVGHLLSEGILKSTAEIDEVNLKEKEATCNVKLKADLFRKTGGVHAAAIYKGDGALVAMAEDVGRHNAVDKAIGIAALKQKKFGEGFLASSGRLSGD